MKCIRRKCRRCGIEIVFCGEGSEEVRLKAEATPWICPNCNSKPLTKEAAKMLAKKSRRR